jgi:hypothetical protein
MNHENCKQCQAAIRINELFREMHAARLNETNFPDWKVAEMKFLAYMLTGEHV